MVQSQIESTTKQKRLLVEHAVALAMRNRWEEAVKWNQEILGIERNDVDAYNRLGRAYTELGRHADARSAYQRAVEIDPNNVIARKNLARLASVRGEEPGSANGGIDLRLFAPETGKTATVNLLRPANKDTLAKVASGDQLVLEIEGRALIAKTRSGKYVGQVEPRLAQRLIDLMKGGNQYAAALLSIESGQPKIIIREIHQHPTQAGKISFPPKVAEAVGVRPYIRGTLLKYGVDEDEDGADDSDDEPLDADEEEEAEAEEEEEETI